MTDMLINPATRPRPLVYGPGLYPRGTYVLATKWPDGDPGDGWAVGFYFGAIEASPTNVRHMVVGSDGHTFRHNGFSRCERLSDERGLWIVSNMKLIEQQMDRFSMWHWKNAPWKELRLLAEMFPTP